MLGYFWDDWRGRATLGALAITALTVPVGLLMHYLVDWSSIAVTSHWITGGFLNDKDSWFAMTQALEWHRTSPDRLYDIFLEQGVKFQYPPSSLLVFAGLEALGITPTFAALNAVNKLLFVLGAAGIGLLAWVLLKPLADAPRHRALRPLVTAFAVVACFFFYPLTLPVDIGQVQVWINTLFIFACVLWLVERRGMAGVLIGLICLLKPQFALFLLWGLVRRQWRFSVAMVATGLIGGLVSLAVFGLPNHLAYLDVLSFISRHGEAYYPNQSFNGLMQRLFGHDPTFHALAFPPFNPIVYYSTLATSALIVAAALFAPAGATPGGRLASFQLAALAFTAASPVAWEHHYGVLAPMLVTAFALLLVGPRVGTSWFVLLGLVYFLAGNYLGVTDWLTGSPLTPLQSYLYAAALGTIALLWRLAGAGSSEARDTAHPQRAAAA